MAGDFQINLYSNVGEFINRLEKFDKDVSKELKKEMRDASKDVAGEARSKWRTIGLPLHNWGYGWNSGNRDLVFHTSDAQAGVKARAYRARRGGNTVAFGYQVAQSNAAAAIFETAGARNKTSLDTRGGSYTFIPNINRKFPGATPRVLYPSYYAGIASARQKIERAVKLAAGKVGL